MAEAGAPPLTLGTAGHIDHGKTALVGALTGVDTDRLPEERRRGISIALGYARLDLPSGRSLSVVDVPGHERFVRTMVAGATGIDLYLLTVAADDGVMPQTREHVAVLRGLDVARGVVAITKADLLEGDTEALALVAEEARELAVAELGREPAVVATSARTGAGLDELRAALDRVADELPGRAADEAPAAVRLHVDRVFTIRGAGTVITGTLWAGSVGRGDEVALLPGGVQARVRAVQVHDNPVERALAGQRVAVNLVGVGRTEVARGDVLVARGADFAPSYVLDAQLDLGEARHELARGGRVQVHHGTREAPARVAALGGRFFQLRLERPLVAAAGDRLVVRRIAPPDTLGGGVVLDPGARKHGASRDALARLERLARGEPAEPDPAGGAAPEDGAAAAPAPPPLSERALALDARLREAGLEPPLDSELGDEAAELAALRAAGRAVRVGRNLHYHADALAHARARILARLEGEGSITIAQLRDELGTSRKFAQALLEHFDGEKLTRRVGDAHVPRRGAGRPVR
ncbi:MAG: selenocysteine-specific translation elongation factor [Actinobacteria bacterium]|nr:MAG: selenocysteine-specific translation elongation factor [Actinomycetota bacterium]